METNRLAETCVEALAGSSESESNDLRNFVDIAFDDFFPLSLVIAIVEVRGGDPVELLYGWLKRRRPDLEKKLREVASR